MDDIRLFVNRIKKIEERNSRVEQDKAWETSSTRRFAIAVLTYFTILLFFLFIHVERPFISAFVPTIGFILSTLSLRFIKKWWLIKHH